MFFNVFDVCKIILELFTSTGCMPTADTAPLLNAETKPTLEVIFISCSRRSVTSVFWSCRFGPISQC